MIKLLICDDEPAVCTLISRFVDCERHQIRLLGFAHDGVQALRLIKQECPQLVITDIRMPGLDGIELIRRVREQGLDTHFVIVSGYGTFDHARSAIRYQVDDFLVKPISERAVEEVVAKMCAVIAAQEASRGGRRAAGDAELSRRKVRSHFISNIIYNDRELQGKDVEQVRREYGLRFRGSCFQVLILKLLPVEKNLRVTEVVRHAEAYMRGILQEKCLEYESYIDRERIVVLLNFHEGSAEALSNVLDYLLRSMIDTQEIAGFTRLLLLRGAIVETLAEISRSFASAERLLPMGIMFGYNKSFAAACLPERAGTQSILPAETYLQRLREVAAGGSREELFEQVRFYLRYHRDTVKDNPDTLPGIVNGLFEFARELLRAVEDNDARVEHARLCALRDYPNCGDIDQLSELLTAELYRVTSLYATLMTNRKNLPILKAREYIEQNFAKQITIEEVAGSVFLSASYFSSLFKQVTGKTFGDYLTEVRINAAKRYIARTGCSIAEIGKMAGYLDPKYFSRIFRKNVGLGPTEYRQICACNMEDDDDA